MATATRPIPALAPPPEPRRPRLLLVGTTLATAGSAALFVGLLSIYTSLRAEALATAGHWIPDGVTIPLTPPNMAAVTLLMSVVTVQWAVYAIGNDDRPNAYVALGLTGFLGLAYVNVAVFLFEQMGLSVNDGEVGLLVFTIAGAHIAMAAAAIVFASVMAFRALGGEYSGRDREGMAAAAIYWDTMVGVYMAIWYVIYITK